MKRHSRNLVKAIRKHIPDPTRAVELGVWAGDNSMALLKAFPSLYLIGIDDFSRETDGTDEAILKATKSFSSHPRGSLWVMKTLHASVYVPNLSLDFVFIDASHDYKSVADDIAAWYSKVRSGGIISGHDYSGHFPGVKRAVEERFGNRFQVEPGRVWWTAKE